MISHYFHIAAADCCRIFRRRQLFFAFSLTPIFSFSLLLIFHAVFSPRLICRHAAFELPLRRRYADILRRRRRRHYDYYCFSAFAADFLPAYFLSPLRRRLFSPPPLRRCVLMLRAITRARYAAAAWRTLTLLMISLSRHADTLMTLRRHIFTPRRLALFRIIFTPYFAPRVFSVCRAAIARRAQSGARHYFDAIS